MRNFKITRLQPEGYDSKIEGLNNTVIYYDKKKLSAIGYTGKAIKPWFHYKYLSLESMMKSIESHLKAVEGKIKRKEERKKERLIEAERLLKETKINDIFYCSWGYEQTNIDFYQVIGIKGKTITFRKIAQKVTKETDLMAEYVAAVKDAFISEPFKKIVKDGYINHTHSILSKWDGKPKYQTHYA